MSAREQAESMPAIPVLRALRTKGVRFWLENGTVKYRAPRGALTRQEIAELRAERARIVEVLSAENEVLPAPRALRPRGEIDRAPLTFSQRAYWRSASLNERPSYRHLVVALKLKGALDISILQASLDALVRRHEALRTNIRVINGEPLQLIAATGSCMLAIDDESAQPRAAWDSRVAAIIDAAVLEPIDLANDPLFAAKLIKLADLEQVLVLSMEHMISDGASLQILVRDLFAIYEQLRSGTSSELRKVAIQFGDYSEWLKTVEEEWIARHAPYWQDRVMGFGRLRQRVHKSVSSRREGWGTVPLRIDGATKSHLQDWSRAHKTTLVMSVFTAYTALMLQWYEVSEAVLRYQTDGRVLPELHDAIGYFATVLHLRVELRPEDTFVDLLARAAREYVSAQAHVDFSWLESRVPEPGFVRNGRFNWVPHIRADGSDFVLGSGISCSDFPFENAVLKRMDFDSEPVVLLYDLGTEVVGAVHYSLSHFEDEAMRRFASNFARMLQEMLVRPEQRVTSIFMK